MSFNPCFSGSCSRIQRMIMERTLLLVSILVLVDLAREFFLHSLTKVNTQFVSILVLVDLAREFHTAKSSVVHSRLVSILVLVDLARESSLFILSKSTLLVSILVLVDLARE